MTDKKYYLVKSKEFRRSIDKYIINEKEIIVECLKIDALYIVRCILEACSNIDLTNIKEAKANIAWEVNDTITNNAYCMNGYFTILLAQEDPDIITIQEFNSLLELSKVVSDGLSGTPRLNYILEIADIFLKDIVPKIRTKYSIANMDVALNGLFADFFIFYDK